MEDFEDGAWWVALASLSNPDLLPQVVASSLGVREVPGRSFMEVLRERLKSAHLLLVLDNCEHLIDACATLADTLLRDCLALKILATSRESLGVAGETSWLVPSLSVPDPRNLARVERSMSYEAIRLFVERARAVSSGLELTEENAPAVVRVLQEVGWYTSCHRACGRQDEGALGSADPQEARGELRCADHFKQDSGSSA